MVSLRQYQVDGIGRLKDSLRAGNRAPIFVAPTGSGKTVCAASIISGAVAKNKRVLFLAHRHELCQQAAMKLAECGIMHSVIAQNSSIRQMQVAQFRKLGKSLIKPNQNVQIGMVQTVVRRLDSVLQPDIISIDECHLSCASTYRTIVDAYPNAILIGLTATPTRLDGVGMGKHAGGLYDDLIILCQPQYLIDEGFLVRPRIFTTPNLPDLSQIKTSMGDYKKDDLADAVDRPSLLGDAVEHYQRAAHGRPAIAFCVSVDHAKHTAERFSEAGYKAIAVDGDSDDMVRANAVAGLGNGTWDIVANCGLYIEGLDQTAIGCVIDLAPTQSLTRYLQKIGRGLRPHPGKTDCIVLDHAGNVARHGMPQADREWTLDGKKKRARKADDGQDVNVQVCEKCYSVHEPSPVCPVCGHVAPIKERKEMEQIDGNLIEVTDEQMEIARKQARIMQGKAQTVEELMKQGKSRMQAQHIIKAREDKSRLIADCINAGVSPGLSELRRMKPKELRSLLENNRSSDDGLVFTGFVG